jgi:hypothetical protein
VQRTLNATATVPNGTVDSDRSASEAPQKESEAAAPATVPRVIGADGKSHPARKSTGKVIKFDDKKALAAEARAVDRQVQSLLNAWEKASPKAQEIFLRSIDIPVFDNSRTEGKR